MWIKTALYLFVCIIAGGAIAAGFVAFITLIGAFEKLNQHFKTGKHSKHVETSIILGVTFFNLIQLLPVSLGISTVYYLIFNLFGGIFVGCLAGALAETLNIFPIISRRFNIRTLLPYVIIFAALGKTVGSIIQLLFFSPS